MDTLICAGGTGTRVLQAVLHLCAAGLGPASFRTFVIDPHAANGNGKQVRALLDRYQKLHEQFGDGPFGFFRTKIDVLRQEGDNQGLQVWSPVKQHQKFEKVLNFEALNSEQKDVVRLLFTEKELSMNMNDGYEAHPALGAAALGLLPLYKGSVPLLAALDGELSNDVNRGITSVVIAGSVFGGTGASTIHPMSRYLRDPNLLPNNSEKLRVAAVAIVPYFQFNPASNADVTTGAAEKAGPRSEHFPLASRSAAEYYQHLYETDDWPFDAMYWIGDDIAKEVTYSPRGGDQTNPGHFVDFLAALACLDFFSNHPNDKACWYAGPEVDAGIHNTLRFDDLPLRDDGIFGKNREQIRLQLALFQTVAAAQLGFYSELLRDPRLASKPECVPWHSARFGKGKSPLTDDTNSKALSLLEQYWREDYLPWWQQVHDAEGRIRLLNSAAWSGGSIRMDRLENVLHPDRPDNTLEPVDRMFNELVSIAEEKNGRLKNDGLPASQYLTLLGLAAERVVESSRKQYTA